MLGLLVASGPSRELDALDWEGARRFCQERGLAMRESPAPSYSENGRTVRGVQLAAPAEKDLISAHPEWTVVIQGCVFGERGGTNAALLGLEDGRSLIAGLLARKQDFTPYDIDGDCALGAIEHRTGRVVVFNDRIGYRRVFYYQRGGLFLATTHLRLMLRLVPQNWVLDRLGARLFLVGREPKWPLSIVEGVSTLPPVHRLDVCEGRPVLRGYWMPSGPGEYPPGEPEALGELRDTILAAITRRAKGRRTVLFLSGGYDSTCLAKITRGMSVPVDAFSAGFEGSPNDETRYSSRVAEFLGVTYTRRIFGIEDVRGGMRDAVACVEQPGHDPTSYLLLSRAARDRGYDAVLHGMGGDACFAEKNQLKRMVKRWPLYWFVSRLPLARLLLRTAGMLGQGRGPFGLALSSGTFPRVRSFYDLKSRLAANPSAIRLLGRSITSDLAQVVPLREPVFERARNHCSAPHEWRYYWAIWDNPDEYHADITITAAGMLPITPFADPLVVDKVMSLAHRYDLETRRAEIRVVGGIPEHLLVPDKQGLAFPYDQWWRHLLDQGLRGVLDSPHWMSALGINSAFLRRFVALLGEQGSVKRSRLPMAAPMILRRLVFLFDYATAYELGAP